MRERVPSLSVSPWQFNLTPAKINKCRGDGVREIVPSSSVSP